MAPTMLAWSRTLHHSSPSHTFLRCTMQYTHTRSLGHPTEKPSLVQVVRLLFVPAQHRRHLCRLFRASHPTPEQKLQARQIPSSLKP